MTQQDRAALIEIHRRDDPEADPPSIALGLDLERRMAEGDIVLFLDHDADPSRSFELHRLQGAFRVSEGTAPPSGTFASAQAAIRAGWAMVNPTPPNPFDQFDAELPPLAALVDEPDPDGGAA